MKRTDLPDILYKIIEEFNGGAPMMDIFKRFWALYKDEMKDTDDIFYTWNYDIRWAATQLRRQGKMKPASTKENIYGADTSPRGYWEII